MFDPCSASRGEDRGCPAEAVHIAHFQDGESKGMFVSLRHAVTDIINNEGGEYISTAKWNPSNKRVTRG
jgi:hypothetical protein